MKFGVSWSLKEISPEARETAKKAARQSGMSLREWLDSVIIQQAEQTGVQSPPLTDENFHGGDLAAVSHRRDDVPQRVEPLASAGLMAYAPKHIRNEFDQRASVSPPPEMPSLRLPPDLDRAIAEIAVRQRVLNGNAAPVPRQQPQAVMAAPAPLPLPAQNLSGLEDQLRNLTHQIETLRQPGIEQAINALREELGEIGRTLSDAMPRRALDAIEKQIQSLDQRISEGRQAGVDAAALGGIEHGLAEVRDALRGLMPAENLVGFTDAITGVAHKIDLIVAQRDPATLAQLESAIITLREMTNHVASNETVHGLAAQVQALGEKIETMANAGTGGDALSHIEHRMAVLSDALTERTQSGAAVPPRLEALVESLANSINSIDQIQGSRGNSDALGHLEDRIVKLVEKLDASDSRLSHLEGIERGLADLLVHVEDMRANKDAGGLRAQGSPEVDGLKHDIARTQDALEAVHGTLGHVVDRLATIEENIRDGARQRGTPESDAAFNQPVGNGAVHLVNDVPAAPAPMPPQTDAAPPPQVPQRIPPVARAPIESDLSADQPLEPGSGPPTPQTNPAARIAASEAALSGARPAAAAGGKSSFIAAARRAAQAAGQQPNGRVSRPEPDNAHKSGTPSLRDKMLKRVKSLFLAASIIAIVVGSVQIAGNVLDLGKSTTKTAKVPASDTVNTEAAVDDAAPEPTAGIAANPLALPKLPAIGPLASPSGTPAIVTTPPLGLNQTTQSIPSLFAPPMLGSKNDITGSISRPAGNSPAARPAAPSTLPSQPSADQLPIAIGGPKLRSAAIAGDGAAAYEVAVRFAEGRGVPINMDEAARWYERAASKGLTPAQFRYASLLEKGQGVKKDLAQARRLYLAAASKGNSKAMHNLAVLYAEGIDGKPDFGTAVQWFRKASQRGVADSQYNLGVLCARGLGTDKSYAEAYKWFALAATQGDRESAKKRDGIAASMDAAALTAAQQAVKSFVAEPQPDEAAAVREPPGGWDHATGAPPRAKSRPAGPLALGAFEMGKR
jgi:localization factor PodJL